MILKLKKLLLIFCIIIFSIFLNIPKKTSDLLAETDFRDFLSDPYKYCKNGLESYWDGKKSYESKNYDVAIKKYKKSANEGCANAAWDLGSIYMDGIKVKKNLKEAFFWRQKCGVTLGDPTCVVSVGTMYVDGIGTNKDVKKGCSLIKTGLPLIPKHPAKVYSTLYGFTCKL